MIKLTALEQDVLTGIYASDYADGPSPSIWSWSIAAKVATSKQIPGVVASLSKKGLVVSDEMDQGRYISVTEKGAEAAQQYGIYTSSN